MKDREARFRAPVARGIASDGKVDREKNIIFGYTVVEKGMARGHGEEIDDVTLDQVVELGNAAEMGIKSRYGHPDMCREALGSFLGRSKNFRRVGDKVLADLHIDPTAFKTPNGDLGSYVLDLAESDPAAFGSSMETKRTLEFRLSENGVRQKGDDGKDLPPLVRVRRFVASDFVDSPAATSGVFSEFFSGTNVLLSAEASYILDQVLSQPDAVERVVAFLHRYMDNRETETMSEETKTKPEPKLLSDEEHRQVLELERDAMRADREALLRERVEIALDRDLAVWREKVEPAQLEKIEPIMRNLKLAELRGGDKGEEAKAQYTNLTALLPSLTSGKAGGSLAESDEGSPVAGAPGGSSIPEERRAQLAAKYPGMGKGIATI